MICVSVLDGGTHATRPSNARVAHSFPVAFSVYSYFLIVVNTQPSMCDRGGDVVTTHQKRRPVPSQTHGEFTVGRTRGPPCGGLAPLYRANARYFRLAAPKRMFWMCGVRCGLCVWVSVLQWRKVPLPFSVSLDGRLYLGFALRVACGRTAPPVCSGTNRKTASLSAVRCAAGMLWCTPENRVSLGGTLRRRYAMVHTGKHRHEARACVGVRRNTSGCSCRGS
jgi:hypothetical protein